MHDTHMNSSLLALQLASFHLQGAAANEASLGHRALPLVSFHLQGLRTQPFSDDFVYDEARRINLSPDGNIACSLASKPYTSCYTPGHTIPAGHTPSGKYRSSRFVNGKTDKRSGK